MSGIFALTFLQLLNLKFPSIFYNEKVQNIFCRQFDSMHDFLRTVNIKKASSIHVMLLCW